MTELTPRNRLPYPTEGVEPYFNDIRAFFLGSDNAHWADAENGNLTYNGGGLFSWSAATSMLTWVAPVYITPFTSPSQAKAIIQGPPAPGGSLTISDGQVAFYTMPRLMQQNTIISLSVGTRVFQSNGTRMHDLRLFCARVGNTLLFPNGKSLKDGESAILFGGGIGTTIPPHVHQPQLVITPPAIGVSVLDLQVTGLADEKLIYVSLTGIFSVGDIVTGGVSGTTATITSVQPTYIAVSGMVGPGFEVGEGITSNANIVQVSVNLPSGTWTVNDLCTATGGATGVIRKINGPILTPTSFLVRVTSGFFPVTGTFTDTSSAATATISNTTLIGAPTADIASIIPPSNLLQVYLFRNGVLQAQGATLDYTVNYATGIVTLNTPTVTNSERFIALRETIPIGTGSTEHQHLKLPIPIVVVTVNLDMQLSSLNPSPNTLVDVYLYRNGALQVQPDDYSLDTATGIVTLVAPANPGEYFIADRLVD